MSKKYLKKNSKGASLVEYAIVLSCICAVGLSFTGDGLTGSLTGVFNKVTNVINQSLGMKDFDEGKFKDSVAALLQSGYKTFEYNHTPPDYHTILGSFFKKDGKFSDTSYEASLMASQKFQTDHLSQIDFGDVPLESWRYLNEGLGGQYAYLIWSDTNWTAGDFEADKYSKTACMYARINKTDNTVEYGVGYANPLDIHEQNGTINGTNTDGGGMVNISEGTIPSDLKFFNNWTQTDSYLAANSPYFTSDYSQATKLYKELQSKSQSK